MPKKLTTEEFIQKAKLIHGDKYDYSKVEYVHSHTKICIICLEHGEFWQLSNDHFKGKGCPKCGGTKLLDNKIFIQKAKLIHGDKYDYSKSNYIKNNIKICIICTEHGEFWQTPQNHLANNGCPKCKRSKGEEQIEKWLKENNILFEFQKRFKDCKNIKPLPFDFYLPDYNICIEFDGEQHFKPIKYWKGKYGFQRTQLFDNIKTNYCYNNHIKFIRISYYNFKNINQILKEEVGFEPTNP